MGCVPLYICPLSLLVITLPQMNRQPMIDGIINNGRRGEELEKAQDEARRTTPEKKPSIRERLEDAKRECGERKPPDKAHQKRPPEHDL